jgi:TRAP transporter TAXI family solute receptor
MLIPLFFSLSLYAEVLTLGITQSVDKVVADVLNQTMHIQTREVNSSQENANLLQKKQIDLAIIQGDTAYHQAKKSMPNLRAIMGLYPKMLAFIVRKDANISSIQEAKTKKLTLSFSQHDTQEIYHDIFDTFDINTSLKAITFNQAQKQTLAHTIDGFFSLQGHPNQATNTLLREHNLSLIPLFGKKFDQLKNDYPFFIKGGMPKGIYGLEEDVKSIGVKALLVTTKEMNEDTIYHITKTILENIDAFKKSNPIYRGMSKKDLVEKLVIPQHKGATKAFNAF